VATLLIPPLWERQQIGQLAAHTIAANQQWFDYISTAFEGQPLQSSEYKLRRKQVYVALAHLSDAFQRMSNEPKAMQQQAPYWQQLLVSNHTLASHIAALYTELQEMPEQEWLDDFLPLTRQCSNRLQTARNYLTQETTALQTGAATGQADTSIRQEVNHLLAQRRQELQQGQLETLTRQRLTDLKSLLDQIDMMLQLAGDIRRVCRRLTKEKVVF
jgi:uncharacterized membrane protein YccC